MIKRGVRLVFESGRPIANVAADLGVHPEDARAPPGVDAGKRNGL